MVACAKPNSEIKSPLMQVFDLTKYCKMATRAGCPNTFAIWAIAFCSSVNKSVLVIPIALSLHCNITMNECNKKTSKGFFILCCLPLANLEGLPKVKEGSKKLRFFKRIPFEKTDIFSLGSSRQVFDRPINSCIGIQYRVYLTTPNVHLRSTQVF